MGVTNFYLYNYNYEEGEIKKKLKKFTAKFNKITKFIIHCIKSTNRKIIFFFGNPINILLIFSW